MARRQEHFSTLLKWPLHPPPSALLSEAATSTPDPLIETFPLTLTETHKTANKIMAGKAPGSCDVYQEYILYGGTEVLRTLHGIFTRVWKDEVISQKWYQLGIIIPLYKGKGSRSDCSKYRGITLLLVPEKVLTASPLENWRSLPGRPRTIWMKTIKQDLKSNNLSLNETIDVAHRSSTLECYVYVWWYTLLVVHARKEEDMVIQHVKTAKIIMVQ